MIKHMFKLIWHRKRRNLLMILEILICFIVLFVVFITVIFQLNNYLKPLGFDYHDVWMITMDWQNQDPESVIATLEQIRTALDAIPAVESHALSNSLMFIPTAVSGAKVKYNGVEISTEYLRGGDDFAEVLRIPILAGRWFTAEDDISYRRALVINRKLEKDLFRGENGLGKIITEDEEECIVVGIISDFRNSGELSRSKKIAFERINLDAEITGSHFVSDNFGKRILIRVKPGTTMDFEEKLVGAISSVAKTFTIRATTMELARQKSNRTNVTLPIILAIVCGFLIINVSLGLFGIIWYNTGKRRPEIGLRRAMGATVIDIYKQIVGESVVLTSIAVGLASLICLQLPLLNPIPFVETKVYYWAWLSSLVLIYLISVLCAAYPGKLAAETQPAMALHEE